MFANVNYCLVLVLSISFINSRAQHGFAWKERKDQKKIELQYNGKLLTAYCYFDSTEKPILYPVRTVSGLTVTRGYPIAPRAGERTDHPHHAGLWFNYESVNGLDFWNNSNAIPKARKHLYGSIKHQEILRAKAAREKAQLKTRSHWVDHAGNVLLEEITDFVFSVKGNDFIIDRTSTLKAVVPEVLFKDVKDGLIAIRVARELEMPSNQKDKFIDAHGNETTVALMNNDKVTGMYVNAEGVRGDDVWSTRSPWTCLHGVLKGEEVSIAILDHAKNPGYPTYWHARGYGLFAANPLGKAVFSKGEAPMNLKLNKGQEVSFTYRVVIHSGSKLTPEEIGELVVGK